MLADPLTLLADAGRRLLVHRIEIAGRGRVAFVFAVRRLPAARMLDLIRSELVGARRRIVDDDDLQARLARAPTEADRDRIRAQAAAAEGAAAAELAQAAADRPELFTEMMASLDEVITSAVVAVGFPADPDHPEGPLPAGARPESLCVPLPDTDPEQFLRPMRWLPAGAVGDGGVPIDHLPEGDRGRLALAVIALFAPQPREVDPFRAGPGAARDSGPVGPAVRPAAVGPAADGPGA